MTGGVVWCRRDNVRVVVRKGLHGRKAFHSACGDAHECNQNWRCVATTNASRPCSRQAHEPKNGRTPRQLSPSINGFGQRPNTGRVEIRLSFDPSGGEAGQELLLRDIKQNHDGRADQDRPGSECSPVGRIFADVGL